MSRSSLPAILLLTIAPLTAGAQTVDQRDYEVRANGKAAGTSRITVTDDKDGTTKVQVEADVKFFILVVQQTFTTKQTEIWKDGKLQSLDADSTERGVRTVVSVRPGSGGLDVRINGAPKTVMAELWTSNFSRLADKKFHNGKVPILEPDSGNDMIGDLKFVGNERIVAAGKSIPCYRFKVDGIATPTDLWYDEHHRLVRQEWTERNQRMIVQMVSRKQP